MLASLALLLLLAAPDSSKQERPLVQRSYPLDVLLVGPGTPARTPSLLPYQVGAGLAEDEARDADGASSPLSSETVESMLRAFLGESELKSAGGSIECRGRDLVVRAPAEFQERAGEFLTRLARALVPTEVLEVRVLSPAPADLPGGVFDASTAEQKLQAAIAAGATLKRALRTGLRDGAAQHAIAGEHETFLYDWGVQIAHASVISDPVPSTMTVGLELQARSARVDRVGAAAKPGTVLDLVLRESEHAAENDVREFDTKSFLWTWPKSGERLAAGRFDHPRMGFVSLAGTLFLPDGAALLLPCTVETVCGTVSFCLDLRVTGSTRPAHAILGTRAPTDGGDAHVMELTSTGAVGLAGFEFALLPRGLFEDGWRQLDDCLLLCHPKSHDRSGDAWNDVAAALPPDRESESLPPIPGHLWSWLSTKAAEKARPTLERLSWIDAPIVVDASIVDVHGRARASFRLPLLEGRPFSLWSGLQGTRIGRWDVDVACYAVTPNPDPEAYLDGFALQFCALRNANGGSDLRVSGKLHFLDGAPRPQELHDALHLVMDQLRAHSLELDETVPLPEKGGAVKLGGSSLSLRLDVAGRSMHDAEPSHDTLVPRHHALGSLLIEPGARDLEIPMLPCRIGVGENALSNSFDFHDRRAEERLIDESDLVEVVKAAVGPSIESLGDEALVVRGNELVVRAPAAVQRNIAQFLARFEEALVPTERLEVRVLTGGPSDLAAGVMDAATADATVHSAIASGATLRRTLSLGLRDGFGARSLEGEQESFVYDWDVQICGASIVACPVSAQVTSGLELAVHSARVEHGTLLGLLLRESEHAAPDQLRRFHAIGRIRLKPLILDREAVIGQVEHPRMGFLSLAGTFFVPEGAALLLPCRVETSCGPQSFTLELRVHGTKRPSHVRFEVKRADGGGEPDQFDLSGTGLRSLGSPSLDLPSAGLFDGGWSLSCPNTAWHGRLERVGLDTDTLEDLRRSLDPASDPAKAPLFAFPGRVASFLPLSALQHAQPILDRAGAFAAPVRVEAVIVDSDGATRAAFTCPLIPGRPLSIWSGLEGTRIRSWDVDVANNAAVPNPDPEAYVDGFALRLCALRDPGGDTALHVTGKLCFLDGPPKARELNDASHLVVDDVVAHTLHLDEIVARPGDHGSAELGGGGLTLKLDWKPMGH